MQTLPPHVPVVVVGAGFAGIAASVALQREGVEHVVLERAGEVGGTWRDNRYPGCRCDVPSHLYSFSFAPNPNWSQTYASHDEIQRYLCRVAHDHGVVDRTQFGHEVLDASWHDDSARWTITTTLGTITADAVVLANGPLAEARVPEVAGAQRFTGRQVHTAQWPADLDLRGRRVAVVGTGASAIQVVPELRKVADSVVVFQRTPPWVLPHRNRPITRAERWLYRHVPLAQRAVRSMVYWSRELVAGPLLSNGPMLGRLEGLARRHLRRGVPDAALRAAITPTYRPGCKRLLPSNEWYPALAAPNVSVVTSPVAALTEQGVVDGTGVERGADVVVWATGFRVIDNPLMARVHGRGGRSLADRYAADGMSAYLGTTVPGFPNLFLLAGPNTGIGHTSLVVMIEAQVRYVVDALGTLRSSGAAALEVRDGTMQAWDREIAARSAPTVWASGGCASWYLDANGRNATIWPDYTFRFVRRTRRFDAASYHLLPQPAGIAGAAVVGGAGGGHRAERAVVRA